MKIYLIIITSLLFAVSCTFEKSENTQTTNNTPPENNSPISFLTKNQLDSIKRVEIKQARKEKKEAAMQRKKDIRNYNQYLHSSKYQFWVNKENADHSSSPEYDAAHIVYQIGTMPGEPNSLYIAVASDGTSRKGLAMYYFDDAKDRGYHFTDVYIIDYRLLKTSKELDILGHCDKNY